MFYSLFLGITRYPEVAKIKYLIMLIPKNITKLVFILSEKVPWRAQPPILLFLLPHHLKYQKNPPAFQRTRNSWLYGLTKIYNEELYVFYHLISMKYEAKNKTWLPLTSQHLKIALVLKSVHTNFKGFNGK